MRSAGCIVNDIVDEKIDRKVSRTKNRPIASGSSKKINSMDVCFNIMFISILSFNTI